MKYDTFRSECDMATLLSYFKKRKTQNGTPEYSLEDYDKTFATTKIVLKFGGLRLLRHQDSDLMRLAWNIFYWFSFANLFVASGLEVMQMIKTAQGGSFQDAIDIVKMMPCVGYVVLGMAKSWKIVYYRPVFENLFSELRSMWPRGPVSDEEHRIISTALKYLNIIIPGYFRCNLLLTVLFLSPSLGIVLERAYGHDVPLILPFFYWLPFDPFTTGYYGVILVFQCWHTLITIWFMLSGDFLFCIFLSHITTQLDLLSIRIKKMVYVPIDKQLLKEFPLAAYSKEYVQKQKRNIEHFGEREWEKTHQKELAMIIERHQALIRLSKDVENMYSFSLLVNFINSSIIICFCGFCCVVVEKWNVMVYKSFLTTALVQTWLLCWYGHKLLESSEKVSDALYSSGWYRSSNKTRSSILIMLHRSQKKVHVTTYGFSTVSLASYTTIIKTAWSYFTLLLNLYKQ